MCLYSYNNNYKNNNDSNYETLQSIYEAIANNDTDNIINLTQAIIDNNPDDANNNILQDYINSLK